MGDKKICDFSFYKIVFFFPCSFECVKLYDSFILKLQFIIYRLRDFEGKNWNGVKQDYFDNKTTNEQNGCRERKRKKNDGFEKPKNNRNN